MEEMESLDKDHVLLKWTTDFTDKIERLEKHQVQLLQQISFLQALRAHNIPERTRGSTKNGSLV